MLEEDGEQVAPVLLVGHVHHRQVVDLLRDALQPLIVAPQLSWEGKMSKTTIFFGAF